MGANGRHSQGTETSQIVAVSPLQMLLNPVVRGMVCLRKVKAPGIR